MAKFASVPANPTSVSEVHMDTHDLAMDWAITLRGASLDPVLLQGHVVLPDIFAQHMLTESISNFEQTFAALIMRPLFSRMVGLLNSHVQPGDNNIAMPPTSSAGTGDAAGRNTPARPGNTAPITRARIFPGN